MFRKLTNPFSLLKMKNNYHYINKSLINSVIPSTSIINDQLSITNVISKKRNLRSSVLLLAFSPYLNVIMNKDGEPSETVSKFLTYTEFYDDHAKDISLMDREEKDQLFYGIAAGYQSKFGKLDEELTKKIIRLIIDGDSDVSRKIVYGLCCAALNKEKKMVRIILEILQEVGVDIHRLVKEDIRESLHPGVKKSADYLESILNKQASTADVFNQKERESVLIKLRNGTEVEEALIQPTMQKIERLKKNPFVFDEFFRKCQNPNYPLSDNNIKFIERFGLMRNGVIDEATRNIALAAVENPDLGEIFLHSPIEESSFSYRK